MLDNLQCPRCQMPLVHCSNEFGNFWACGACEGTAVTISLLRKFVARDTMNELWQAARGYTHLHKLECPGCQNRMEEVPLKVGGADHLIDVCGHCQFIWLDAGEWDALPHAQVDSAAPLSQPARESLAMAEIECVRENHRIEFGDRQEPVWDFWDLVSGEVGAPWVMRFILRLLRRH